MKAILALTLLLIAITSPVLAEQPQNVDSILLKFADRPEFIEYRVAEATDSFPPTFSGTDISYQWLPSKKFRLSRLFDTSVGETPASIPWRANSPKLVYDWVGLEQAFEAEMRKTYSSPVAHAPAPQETKQPIIGGSFERELTPEQLEKMGKITSFIFLVFPNEVTLAGAVVADGLVAFNKLTGDAGLIAGYNPFLGVTYFIPKDAEHFAKKVAGTASDMAKDAARSGLAGSTVASTVALADMAKNGKIDKKVIVNQVLPTIALGVPVTTETLKKVANDPVGATTGGVQHLGGEINKQGKKLGLWK